MKSPGMKRRRDIIFRMVGRSFQAKVYQFGGALIRPNDGSGPSSRNQMQVSEARFIHARSTVLSDAALVELAVFMRAFINVHVSTSTSLV